MIKASGMGIEASAFREPDLGNSLTAIAIAPTGAKIVKNLKLALASPKSRGNHGHAERAVRYPRDQVVLAEVETIPQAADCPTPAPGLQEEHGGRGASRDCRMG